jgi:enoyl-CoA hydratase/carnithine racemase
LRWSRSERRGVDGSLESAQRPFWLRAQSDPFLSLEISVDYQQIAYTLDEGLLTITLNRPEQLNAFTPQMAAELINAFELARRDDAVRAVIVTGAGKAFCAGMDLAAEGNVFGLDESLAPTLGDMRERLNDPAIVHGVRDTGGRVALAIYECTKPVIGAINGAAVGIGATMTSPMDFRLASEKARIGFVFGKIGIVPEACSSWFLPRIVGISQALEWVYSADIFDAQEAKRGGLVRGVYPAEQLLDEAKRLARRFVDNRSPVAIALARQMMYRNAAQPHPLEAHRIDSLAMYYTSIGDGKEGVRSFLEKRAPQFSARASALPSFYEEWVAGKKDE